MIDCVYVAALLCFKAKGMIDKGGGLSWKHPKGHAEGG